MPLRCSAFVAVFSSAGSAAGGINKSLGPVSEGGVCPRQALIKVLERLGAQPVEWLSPTIKRQRLEGAPSTFQRWRFKAGVVLPMRRNPGEQILWLMQGRAQAEADGQAVVMASGDVMIVPPYTPHALAFTQDTDLIAITTFEPRADTRQGRTPRDLAEHAHPASGQRAWRSRPHERRATKGARPS